MSEWIVMVLSYVVCFKYVLEYVYPIATTNKSRTVTHTTIIYTYTYKMPSADRNTSVYCTEAATRLGSSK